MELSAVVIRTGHIDRQVSDEVIKIKLKLFEPYRFVRRLSCGQFARHKEHSTEVRFGILCWHGAWNHIDLVRCDNAKAFAVILGVDRHDMQDAEAGIVGVRPPCLCRDVIAQDDVIQPGAISLCHHQVNDAIDIHKSSIVEPIS